ncbi:MAG: TonB-dependent receptor [Halioglobus sp.]
MLKRNRLTLAVAAATGLTAAAAMPQFAYAQGERAVVEEGALEEVVVTGSRISRPDLEGANPVTVLQRTELTMMGVNNVGDILQNITASAGEATNTNVNNGGEGAVRFSLRGLGAQRTLVLLNGKRVVASGLGADDSVDLGNIPVAMIERVEILKDGASAVYGSDAIAGVVNVITRRNFEGFEVNGYLGEASEGDGEQESMDFTLGVNGDRGNAVVNAWWNNTKQVTAGDRDFSSNELWYRPYWNPDIIATGGSSAPPWGNHADPTTGTRYTRGPEGGDWREYNNDPYNYAPANYLATPNERWGINFSGSFEFGDMGVLKNMAFLTDAFYTHSESDVLLAPEPLAPLVFFGVEAPYSADNYYNQEFGPKNEAGETFEIDDWRRRMVETGGRASQYETETYQLHIALEGDSFNWNWELAGGYGENNSSQYETGYFNLDRVGEAVGPTHFDADGALQCGPSADQAIAGCVPLNIFGEPGTDQQVTQEMLAYVSGNYNAFTNGKNQLKSVTFNSSNSDVFSLPAGPLGIAFGLEKHWYDGAQTVDTNQLLGTSTAGVALNTAGGYDVEEAFIEFNIPLLADIPLIKYLELNIASRYSDYSTYGDTTNSKLNVRWQMLDSLTFRGTAGTSFRAPSIPELFEGQFRNFPNASDPCATNPTPTCVASGVPPGGYDASGIVQIPSDEGGNPNLEEETADTFTMGFVYEPNWWENTSLTMDYWDIDIDNPVTTVGVQSRLDGCAATGAFCESINRFGPGSSAWGNITSVEDLNSNAGSIKTSGVDLSWRTMLPETSFGLFSLGLEWTYLIEYDKENADGTIDPHAGVFLDEGNGYGDGLFARNRGIFSAAWMMDNWSASWRSNYTSGVNEDLTPAFWSSDEYPERDGRSFLTHDIQFQYEFSNWNTRISLGADNITDEEPPKLYSSFANNTSPNYDHIGRYYYARVTLSF